MDTELMQGLMDLARNLRWAWHSPTADVFHDLAPDVWEQSRNPIAVVTTVARAPQLLEAHAERVAALENDLDHYMRRRPSHTGAPRVAYFSAEFAVAECLPIYSGGLGVLAGDHLKAASDVGVPLIGAGLLYRYGYFRQGIDAAGQQREYYDRLEPASIPLQLVFASKGVPLEIGVPLGRRNVFARIWLAQVGRVPLYLLDSDLPRNREDDRWITGHLYGGDSDTRLRQEILLGIGGARLLEALRVLGLEAEREVYHLNEGHSAFVAVERTAERMRTASERDFFAAHRHIAESLAFTTHTPVAAGHDTFAPDLIESYLGEYREQLGLSHDQFMSLGRREARNPEEPFNMTVLALRSAHARNAVSQLHGVVSRRAWRSVGVGTRDVQPLMEMEAITNGVHTATWVGPEMTHFLDGSIGSGWRERPQDRSAWTPLAQADRHDLWVARGAQRGRLLREIENRVSRKLDLNTQSPLVIGFARRFATYKRAGLMLRHPAWLERVLHDPVQPLLLLFAGKAHPHDAPGKALVQRVVEASQDPRFLGRIVFLQDYDVELARLMVQGSDVWLNTPRRPMEASGTSGMKAVLNGALKVSELDGWWDEAYAPGLGWALGGGLPTAISDETRDEAEAAQMMDLLEAEIVPLFFQRDADGVPMEWLAQVKRSMEVLSPTFSAHRMIDEYVQRIYQPLSWMTAQSFEHTEMDTRAA